MSNLRRYNPNGRSIFITTVTYKRQPILIDNADLLLSALNEALNKDQAKLLAWVIMTDHLHLLLDTRSADISATMHRFKLSFASRYRKRYNIYKGRIWQLRFWDHIIRDEKDYNRHLDYIHYNPVKHGLVKAPKLFPHSSIHHYSNYYQQDWGVTETPQIEGKFGE
ncbi:MAG: transposase [candidate division Zixibacteria bacterium]|nr:transposase [candidate division Zixibacteria bacterium]